MVRSTIRALINVSLLALLHTNRDLSSAYMMGVHLRAGFSQTSRIKETDAEKGLSNI